ncbi:MAG: hypothetical protein O3A38_01320, partial [Proteobacteria bacterium]|nr:hypothetical protein [Pseudomonadota bacterium]
MLRRIVLLATAVFLWAAAPAMADVEADINAAYAAADAGDLAEARRLLTLVVDSGELSPDRQAVMLEARGVLLVLLNEPA